MEEGYALIKSPIPGEAPAMMAFEDFLLLWEDAHKHNPKRWPHILIAGGRYHGRAAAMKAISKKVKNEDNQTVPNVSNTNAAPK